MSRVSTNSISLAYTIESSLGVAGTVWKLLEPNAITAFGPKLTTVQRNPISKDRQRKKGSITGLDSEAGFDADLTMEHFIDFAEGFCFSTFNGPAKFGPMETNDVTAVTSTGYTVAASGALAQNTLVLARGFSTAANNGLKVVGASSTATEVKTSGLTAEASPPTNATLEVCGVQGATGDITMDSSGHLNSTVLDFTTLGLTVGQAIWVGDAGTSYRFGSGAEAEYGFARIGIIAAHKLTLNKRPSVWGAQAGTGKTVRIFFGKFLRNVPVDDADYIERSFQFEGAYPDLGGVGTDGYEYSVGNYCNEMTVELPLTDKALIKFGFVGTNTEAATTSRKTGANTPIEPVQTVAFNTSSDIGRLRVTEVDETGLSSYFKKLTLKIKNNVSPEKVIGVLGAAFMNTGNFDVDVDAQMLFTATDVTAAIRDNTTVTMDFALRNDDGGLFFDLPAVTLGGGNKEFPENETVLINTPATAFEDPTLGTSIGISLFGYLPTL